MSEPANISTDHTTFTELQQHMRKHFDRLNQSGGALYVMDGDSPDAVVMSHQTYLSLIEKLNFIRDLAGIDQGAADFQAGRFVEMRQGIENIADELGLDLNR